MFSERVVLIQHYFNIMKIFGSVHQRSHMGFEFSLTTISMVTSISFINITGQLDFVFLPD
jgi:hypothetical protein